MSNSITITREEFMKAVNATIDFLKSQNIEVSQTLFCSYLSDMLFEDVKADVQEAKLEPFTDNEQKIFLAVMGREEKVCKDVDKEFGVPYEDSLVRICKEIERKVKKALWKK